MQPTISIFDDLIDIGKLIFVFLVALVVICVIFIYKSLLFIANGVNYICKAATRKDSGGDRAPVYVGKGRDEGLKPVAGAGVAARLKGMFIPNGTITNGRDDVGRSLSRGDQTN